MSTMPDHLAGEELVASLKQLVISFCPYIKESGSVEQAEDSIVHMEENNENFHRLVLTHRCPTTGVAVFWGGTIHVGHVDMRTSTG